MKAVTLDIAVNADQAVVWHENNLYLLDQRVLPSIEQFIALRTAQETADAISSMVVRGAPAIGVTAAYGAVLAGREVFARHGSNWKAFIGPLLSLLEQARPTAINLSWAISRMRTFIEQLDDLDPEPALLEQAMRIHQEDIASCRTMGDFGATMLAPSSGVITHCNAGALATGGYGTALGVVRSAFAAGKLERVFVDETRPWMQGSRLTAWELSRDGIPVTLLADGAAASRMVAGGVNWMIVGSDRIAANGDVANKIGTYHLALAARHHGVKIMVAAPTSTIDMSVSSGKDIPIEERDPAELFGCGGNRIAASNISAWNPVFDITPAGLVDVIVTEKGVVHAPDAKKMKKHMFG